MTENCNQQHHTLKGGRCDLPKGHNGDHSCLVLEADKRYAIHRFYWMIEPQKQTMSSGLKQFSKDAKKMIADLKKRKKP